MTSPKIEPSRPLIAIPLAEISSTLPTEPPLWAMRSSYVQPLLAENALPVFLPQITKLTDLEPLLDHIDGLLLAGGADIHPELYGSVPEKNLGDVDRARDHSEFLVTQWALKKKLPILAICRGMQMVSIAAGGTLYQDIPTDLDIPTIHRREPITYATLTHHGHLIRIEPDSRLAAIVKLKEVWVNSMHHQAVKKMGEGLVVTARSVDGVIEGLETTDPHHWVVGLESHPEAMAEQDPWALTLFKEFIKATLVYHHQKTSR